MVVDSNFWNRKRVLVTGHTGFKGSWLSLWLSQLGAEVIGFALPAPTTPSLFELANVARDMESLTGDIRNREAVSAVMRRYRPEIVLHLAAQSLVRESYRDPVSTYETNVMGTVHLLNAVRRCDSVRAIVVVSSDKCYENQEWVWGYREDEPLGGYDPYSSSKACTELVTAAFRRSYFFNSPGIKHVGVGSGRAGNVIGGGDWAPDRLVPDVLRAFAAGVSVAIRNPHATRPWQHVLEPLAGYLALAQRLYDGSEGFAEPWNFGPETPEHQTVAWVVDQLAMLWGDDASWHEEIGNHPHEATYLSLDCAKARRHLGWKPRLSLPVALEWVVEWYRCHEEAGDVEELTRAQIARYQGVA